MTFRVWPLWLSTAAKFPPLVGSTAQETPVRRASSTTTLIISFLRVIILRGLPKRTIKAVESVD